MKTISMPKLSGWASVLMLAAGAGVAPVAAQTPDAGPPALQASLTQEACRLQDRSDLAPVPGVPPEALVLCSDRQVGSIVYARHYPRARAEAAADLLRTYEAQSAASALRQRLSCQQARPLGLDKTVMALPCRLNDGGWPHLVLLGLMAREGQSLMAIAEGPPTLLPSLLSALRPQPSQSSAASSAWTAELQSVFGGPVPLATAAELAGFRQRVSDARTANNQGRYRDAETLFRQTLDLQTRLLAPTDVAIADTLMDLALNVSNQGRDEEALALFRRAEPVIQVSPNAGDRARLALYQGYHAANFGRYEEALAFAGGSAGLWRQVLSGPDLSVLLPGQEPGGGDSMLAARGELALALNLQANMALRTESVGLAEAAATEALQILNTYRSLPRWWKADVLLTLGRVSAANGRLSAAERYLNTALAERRLVSGDGPATVRILAALGQAYQREGMNTSAIITYRDIFRLIKSLPPTAQAPIDKEDLVPFGLAVTAYADTLTRDEERQGLYNEAFDAFQLVRPSVVEQTVSRASARLALDEPALARLVDALQSAERARDAALLELSFETSLPDSQRSREAEDRLQQASAQAEQTLLRLQRQMAQEHPQYLALATPRPLASVQLRQRLAAREAVVSFLVGQEVSFVQLVRREGVFVARVPAGSEDLAESVSRLRRALEIQAGSVNDFDLGLAHQLYSQLLGPVARHLADIEHLVVVPAGPLASLPFALLVEQPPGASGTPVAYSQATWLVRRMAISHMPSLRSFQALRSTAPRQAPRQGLLAFGDPVLGGSAAGQSLRAASGPADAGEPSRGLAPGLSALASSCRTGGPASGAQLRALAPLPETAAELQAVGRVFSSAGRGARLFAGRQATETELRRQSLQDYRVLYFATHGLLPGELRCQAEPALVLTPPEQEAGSRAEDGLLEASEIAALRLNADLVVLSACNTAGSAGRFGGDALSGLAEAFFHAGARGMVVSHWQVPSAATAGLMTGLFARLGPDLQAGAAASLQGAQQALIARSETAHPFFWAAFVMVGDGQADSRLPVARGSRP